MSRRSCMGLDLQERHFTARGELPAHLVTSTSECENAHGTTRLEQPARQSGRLVGWAVAADTFWRNIRYGLRRLRKQPAFTALAVTTLALGVGATTTIFSIIHSVLLNPFPYADADRVAVIQIQDVAFARPSGAAAF